jgi:hypothetical protein
VTFLDDNKSQVKLGFALGLWFNATVNNISVKSLWSVLLVDETGVPPENRRPVTSH